MGAKSLFGLGKTDTKNGSITPAAPPTEAAAQTAPAAGEPATGESSSDAHGLEKIKQAVEAAAEQKSTQARPADLPHAFVIMPFGKKKGADGQTLDFNAIYNDLIKPSLIMAGFEPFRADEETKSGDILTDMFQELLLADLALVDMSIDNANVFYELGIRHAFRKRGIVHIQAGRGYMPFDVFNVRTIPYHVSAEGVPDPLFIEKDCVSIARVARDTWASDKESIHSPVFNLLTGLIEPDRRTLRTPLATGFWREYNEWRERVTIAQRRKRIGDILLLTEEIRNPLIKEEAIGEAGRAFENLGLNELALDQYRHGLELDSTNLEFRRRESFHLNRLGRVDEAIVKLESLLNDSPRDTEAIAYLGRIYKEMWVDSWKDLPDKKSRLKTAFETYHWLLKSAHTYLRAYRADLDEVYPGINAMTLATILLYLADKFENPEDRDPEIAKLRELMEELSGSLIFALESRAEDERAEYWPLVSLAEMRVLTAPKEESVVRAYRKALTASRRNQFYLQSSIKQLEMIKALGIRTQYVAVGLQVLNEELAHIQTEEKNTKGNPKGLALSPARSSKKKRSAKKNSEIFLFTGYMVDYEGKEQSTFPKDQEAEVRAEILRRLDKLKADPEDMVFLGGLSAGSEIIFAELCAERGIHIEAHLPLAEAAYIREFVSPAGDEWVDRFYKIRTNPFVEEIYQAEAVGEPAADVDAYERNNRWTYYSSIARGKDKVRLIALWDGKGGRSHDRDAQLVKHMVNLIRDSGGKLEHINSAKFTHTGYTALEDLLGDYSSLAHSTTKKKLNVTKRGPKLNPQ